MVEALYIAATQDQETAVADYLQVQLEAGSLTLAGLQQQFGTTPTGALPSSTVQQHPLAAYDQLLSNHASPSSIPTPDSNGREQPLPQSQPAPQATASLPYAQPVAEHRTAGDSGGVVVRSIFARTLSIGVRPPLPGANATRPARVPTAARKKFYQL